MTRPIGPDWLCWGGLLEWEEYLGHVMETVYGSNGEEIWRCARCKEIRQPVEADAVALMRDGAGMIGEDVAEAILDLEGYADCWPDVEWEPGGPDFSEVALAALHHVKAWIVETGNLLGGNKPHALEAAALLRDGWRPGGES